MGGDGKPIVIDVLLSGDNKSAVAFSEGEVWLRGLRSGGSICGSICRAVNGTETESGLCSQEEIGGSGRRGEVRGHRRL